MTQTVTLLPRQTLGPTEDLFVDLHVANGMSREAAFEQLTLARRLVAEEEGIVMIEHEDGSVTLARPGS